MEVCWRGLKMSAASRLLQLLKREIWGDSETRSTRGRFLITQRCSQAPSSDRLVSKSPDDLWAMRSRQVHEPSGFLRCALDAAGRGPPICGLTPVNCITEPRNHLLLSTLLLSLK